MPTQREALTRTINFCDELIEIETYQEKHRPQAQQQVGEGYPLNPVLPSHFDQTPNEEREAMEVEDWWDLPFIITETWAERESHLRAVQARHKEEKNEYAKSDEEVEALVAEHRESWHKHFPSGTQYCVRCLDGGAWDRSTFWGQFDTLEAALECCNKGPQWRRGMS